MLTEQEMIALVNDPSRQPIYQGSYSADCEYQRDDVVTHYTYVYIAEQTVPAHVFGGAANDFYWRLLRGGPEDFGVNHMANSPGVLLSSEPYDSSKSYFRGTTAAAADESIYLALKFVPAMIEGGLSNSEYWALFAVRGEAATCDTIDASAFQFNPADLRPLDSALISGPYGATISTDVLQATTISSVPTTTPLVCNYLVGAAAVLLNEDTGEALIGLRVDNGLWALFGGKADTNESMAEAVAREVGEEIGLHLPAERYTHMMITEEWNAHQRCLTSYLYAVVNSAEIATITNREPNKCSTLEWFAPNNLPENVWQRGAEMIRAASALRQIGR